MKRSLGYWPLLATIYFCVSGGPYGLEPTFQAGKGLGMLLVIVTPFIWAFPTALMSAELAAAMPEEGGYYVWVKRAMGPFAGYLCAVWTWLYAWVDVAIYPGLFVVNLHNVLRLCGFDVNLIENAWIKWSIGLLIIVPFTILNIFGTRKVGIGAVAMLSVLLAPFLVVCAVGLPKLFQNPGSVVHPFLESSAPVQAAIGTGLFSVMWNYLGWDSMTTVSGEVENPTRNIPRALVVGVVLVIASYVLPSLVGLAIQPDPAAWKEGAWTAIAVKAGGRWLGLAVAIGGTISAAGLFASTLLASSRLPFVLARDGYLPSGFTKLHAKFDTPVRAILISAIFYSIFSFSKFEDLKIVDVILYSSALLLEFIALVKLRVKAPQMPRPYRIPGGVLGVVLLSIAPTLLIIFAIIMQTKSDSKALPWASICLVVTAALYPALKPRRRDDSMSSESMT